MSTCLPACECETGTRLKEKISGVPDQAVFQFALAGLASYRKKVESIGIFECFAGEV